jgi:hypothetical protein
MNWRGKVTAAILGIAAVIVWSCKDEVTFLGFRNPTPKFETRYVEFPVESSVIWLDSLRTSNFIFNGEGNRFLLGKYQDDLLGEVSASFYTQYFGFVLGKIDVNSVLDSVVLQLRYDLYTYGSISTNPQTFEVYELAKTISRTESRNYFNKTSVPLGDLIGTGTIYPNPILFKNKLDSGNTSEVFKVRIRLDQAFGQRLFNTVLRWSSPTPTYEDSAFIRPNDFFKIHKGIAIKPVFGDKIVGFHASDVESKLILHYHNPTDDSLQYTFIFSSFVASFNEIKSNRTGTDVQLINQYFTDYDPPSGLRYVQNGVGLFTKLDLSSFVDFLEADTIPNMAINAAQLIIENVEPPGGLAPPNELYVRVLDPDNRLRKFNRQKTAEARTRDQKILARYNNLARTLDIDVARVNNDSVFTVFSDFGSYLSLNYNSTSNSYQGFLTLFAQEMALEEPDKPRFRHFILYPLNAGKTVNRVAFHKNNIKLRIYYTRPLTGI